MHRTLQTKFFHCTAQSVSHKPAFSRLFVTQTNPQDPVIISAINGVPKNLLKNRKAIIYMTAKSSTQSGSRGINQWKFEFERSADKWAAPLMGWTSSTDQVHGISLEFATKEEAVEYALKNGF
jgi:hypothetical protein